jgi:hypothetical protein
MNSESIHDNTQEKDIDNPNLSLKIKKRDRIAYIIASIVILSFIILHHTNILPLNIVVIILLWIVFIIFIGLSYESFEEIDRIKFELENKGHIKKIQLTHSNIPEEERTYFDSLVSINIDNLSDYYILVKIHSRQSFRFVSIVGFIGFILIIFGISINFVFTDQIPISILSTSAGVIMEIINGIFFYLYNNTIRQLKEYHDSLLDVQNILLSFKLIDGVKDENIKMNIIQTMIGYLTRKNTSFISKQECKSSPN